MEESCYDQGLAITEHFESRLKMALCLRQLYRGAGKSLARPGWKQATGTKLKLLQATQKQFRRLSVQPCLRGSNDLRVGRKMATFQLFFSVGSG